ncbi:MAG: outer membrane beta-barrel protein [Salinibacter sp.]
MNRFITYTATLLLAFGMVLPMSAQAQTDVSIGPRIGVPLGDMSDLEGQVFFGADARINSEALPVVLSPSFDFYAFDAPEGSDVSGFAIDLNAFYEFGIDNQAFTPYAGGGLGITRYSSVAEDPGFGGQTAFETTEVGLNLVGGARFMLDPVEPFVQLNAKVGSDIDRLGIAGGILFNF